MKALSRKIAGTVLLSSLACSVVAQASAPGDFLPEPVRATLSAGDPAPSFRVGQWVKGTPVKALRKDRITVIDFWGTRCIPCIALFPELTEMAKKYEGKVDIIGVAITRTPGGTPYGDNTPESRRKFMDVHGPSMGYHVAFDTMEGHGHMNEHWLMAAGMSGIPKVFVVGGDGRIVWLGSGKKLAGVLPAIVDGTFDAKAFEKHWKSRSTEITVNNAMNAAWAAASAAHKAYDHARVVAVYEKFFDTFPPAEYPEVAMPTFKLMHMVALAHVDDNKAYALATAKTGRESVDLALGLAAEADLSSRMYEYAVGALEAAQSTRQGGARTLNALAEAYSRLGNEAKAEDARQRAKAAGASVPDSSGTVSVIDILPKRTKAAGASAPDKAGGP